MKLLAPLVCLVLVLACVSQQTTAKPQGIIDFARGAVRGTRDMYRAYQDMREANWRNSDRYFHARGNRDAARHGAGGRFAASVISNARELTDRIRGGTAGASRRDQEANRWGRNGGDPNRYRPNGLPDRY